MFSKKEVDNIINLYQAKQSMENISRLYNCAVNTIRNVLIKNNIERRKPTAILRPKNNFDDKDIKRFWIKVKKGNLDECWEWLANKDMCGYGRFGFRNKLLSAHRVVFEIANGKIKGNLHVLHNCDNPGCCNPNHLFLGSHQDNMDDRSRKKRTKGGRLVGSKNPSHRFKENDILKIRELHKNGYKQKDIAKKFNTVQAVISNIVLRKTWKHI